MQTCGVPFEAVLSGTFGLEGAANNDFAWCTLTNQDRGLQLCVVQFVDGLLHFSSPVQ